MLVKTGGVRLTRRDAAISKRRKKENETNLLRGLNRTNGDSNRRQRELLERVRTLLEALRGVSVGIKPATRASDGQQLSSYPCSEMYHSKRVGTGARKNWRYHYEPTRFVLVSILKMSFNSHAGPLGSASRYIVASRVSR